MKRVYLAKLFINFLFLMIIPIVIISTFNYRFSSDSLEKEIRNTNTALLENVVGMVDARITTIKRDFITFMQTEKSLVQLQEGSFKSDLKYTEDLLTNLRRFKTKYDYIEEMLIYIKEEKYVLTTGGSHNGDDYFEILQAGRLSAYLDTPHFFELRPGSYLYGPERFGLQVVLLNCTLPFKKEDFDIFVSIIINTDKIRQDLEDFRTANAGFLMVVDKQDQLITTSYQFPEDFLENVRQYEELELVRSQDITTVNGVKYITMGAESRYNDWYYTAFIPYSNITKRLQYGKIVTIVLCGFFIMIGFLTALLASRKLYQPIGDLTSLFVEEDSKVVDEMHLLDVSINHILHQNSNMQRKLMESAVILQDNLIRKLLHNNLQAEEIKGLLDQHNLRFFNAYYCVFILQLKVHSMDISIESILNLCYENYHKITEGDHHIVVLNFNDQSKLQHIIQAFESYPVVITKGEVVKEVERIPISYEQAVHCMQYKKLHNTFEYICYEDILWDMELDHCLYSNQFEHQFSNCIKSGHFQQGMECVEKVINAYIREDIASCFIERNMDNLLNFLSKLCAKFNWSMKHIFGEDFDYDKQKTALHTAKQHQEYMLKLYERFVEYAKNYKGHLDTEFFDEILSYVHNNYTEEISLNIIADYFNVSYHHLSKLFKHYLGDGYAEYITKLRIEKAKELIVKKKYKVETIAQMVGYNNTVSFIRNFKKYEGVAPGQYRKNETDPQ